MMRKKTTILLCIIPLFLLGTLSAGAAIPNNMVLYPIEDAALTFNDPDQNKGTSSYLDAWEVYYGSSEEYNFGRRSYLKFDVSSIPDESTIESAVLELYLWDENDETCSVGAHICQDNSWDEIGITWNSAPTFDLTPIDVCDSIATIGWYYWNIESAVENALSSDVLSVVLTEANTPDICSFYSREAYDEELKPKLTIRLDGFQSQDPGTDDTQENKDSSGGSLTATETGGTPGFELIAALGAIIVLFLWRRHKTNI